MHLVYLIDVAYLTFTSFRLKCNLRNVTSSRAIYLALEITLLSNGDTVHVVQTASIYMLASHGVSAMLDSSRRRVSCDGTALAPFHVFLRLCGPLYIISSAALRNFCYVLSLSVLWGSTPVWKVDSWQTFP